MQKENSFYYNMSHVWSQYDYPVQKLHLKYSFDIY
jgi:hypothetical protein